jgi:hypothetical protein
MGEEAGEMLRETHCGNNSFMFVPLPFRTVKNQVTKIKSQPRITAGGTAFI